MSYTSEDPDDFLHWEISVPDRFRDQARGLENSDYDHTANRRNGDRTTGDRTLNNSLLAESILRDRILPFANDNISLESNDFEASRGFERRYDILTIPIHVPRPLGEHIADLAKESQYAEWNYDLRARQNSYTEEFVLRDIILASEIGGDENGED